MQQHLKTSARISSSPAEKIAAALFLVIAAFQAALAAGAPWGGASYGGGHRGTLPARLRASSAGATLLYGGLSALTLTTRGRIAKRRVLTVVTAVMALGTAMNLASPSRVERTVWTPVAGVLTVALVRVVRDLRH